MGLTLERLVVGVCAFDIDRLQAKGRNNNLSLAKSLICFWGLDKLGVSTTEPMRLLDISQPSVSTSARRGSLYCLENDVDVMQIIS